MISCDSSEHPPFLSPSSTFTGHSSGGCWVIVPRGTSSGAQQLSTAVSAMLGWVRPLSWSLAGFDPSLVTDKQRTTWPHQADTDRQTHSHIHTLQETDSLTCGYSHSGMKTAREQPCEYNISVISLSLSLSISNTTHVCKQNHVQSAFWNTLIHNTWSPSLPL